METILATAFGYKVELLRGKVDGGDELVQAARDVFNIPIGGGMFHTKCEQMLLSGSNMFSLCCSIRALPVYCSVDK